MSDWNQHCAAIRRELTALEKDGHLVEGPVTVAHSDMEVDLYELEKGLPTSNLWADEHRTPGRPDDLSRKRRLHF